MPFLFIPIVMTDLRLSMLSLALLASSSSATAEFAAPTQPTALFDKVDDAGYGQFSGKLQSLLMHRDMERAGQGTSGTLALTMNYLTPELGPFRLGGQFIYSGLVFQSGDSAIINSGYWLSNDEFGLINEGYLTIDLAKMKIPRTELKIGRQVVNYDFAPTYNIRQKDQSFEAIILKTEPVDGLHVDLGHLERFSSWASRSGGPSTWRANFIDVERRVGVPYSTNGFQFISAVYDGCKPWNFTLYDFYGDDMYNTFGAKVAYRWDMGQNAGAVTLRTHYAYQQDVGRMKRDGLGSIGSTAWEVALDYARGGFTLSLGGFIVRGDDFQTPFRTSFTIDTELLWYTMQFAGGSSSGFLKGVYKCNSWMFYTMYVITDHNDGTFCQEIDAVVKYSFNKNIYTAVKAGYGHRNNHRLFGRNSDALDLRWFAGWSF